MPPPKQPTFSSRRRIASHSIQLSAHAHSGRRSRALERDLARRSSAAALQSLVVYGLARASSSRRGRTVGAATAPSARPPTPTLAVVDDLTADDLRACAGARRSVARRRARHAAARSPRTSSADRSTRSRSSSARSSPTTRVVSGSDPVRRPARRSRRPAARVRGAGAQPSAAPARGLSRDARPRRRARGADRAVGARRSPRCCTSVARLDGVDGAAMPTPRRVTSSARWSCPPAASTRSSPARRRQRRSRPTRPSGCFPPISTPSSGSTRYIDRWSAADDRASIACGRDRSACSPASLGVHRRARDRRVLRRPAASALRPAALSRAQAHDAAARADRSRSTTSRTSSTRRAQPRSIG